MNTNNESFLPYLREFVLAHSSWIFSPPPPPFNLQRGSDVTRMCCSFLFLRYNGFAEIYILRRIVRIVELATKWLFSVKSRLLDKLYLCLFVCTWHFVTRYLRKAWSWNLKVFHAILKFIELLSYLLTSLHKLKSCLKRGILLSRLLKSENSFELQINFQINIHICAQSCTCKKSFQTTRNMSVFLASIESRNSSFWTLDIAFSVQVGKFFFKLDEVLQIPWQGFIPLTLSRLLFR